MREKAVDAAGEGTLRPGKLTYKLKHEADAKATKRIADQRARERHSQRGEASLRGLSAALAIMAINKTPTCLDQARRSRDLALALSRRGNSIASKHEA